MSTYHEPTERPAWAERLHRERVARGWTPHDVVAAMRTFSDAPLPDPLAGEWELWETGRNLPDEAFRPLIAATFGTVVRSIFEEPRQLPPRVDTGELVERLQSRPLDDRALEALALAVEQLCCEYSSRDAAELLAESRAWLKQVTHLVERRLLDAAGWLNLLIGCLEYDLGLREQAMATRETALAVGRAAGNVDVVGWAHEMRAWFALTNDQYREVIEAAQAGHDAAPGRLVSVQLLAQEAKAWARLGVKRNVIHALEKGRALFDSLPSEGRMDNHFIIDPGKFDYHSMDCFRLVGDDQLAEVLAGETIRKSISPTGEVLAPMRKAEAELTLGVVAARRGELPAALEWGHAALRIPRRSRPSLLRVGAELDRALRERFPGETGVHDFQQRLLAATAVTEGH